MQASWGRPLSDIGAFIVLCIISVVLSVGQRAGADRTSLFKKGAIRVLILTGQNNHDWRATTPLLQQCSSTRGASMSE